MNKMQVTTQSEFSVGTHTRLRKLATAISSILALSVLTACQPQAKSESSATEGAAVLSTASHTNSGLSVSANSLVQQVPHVVSKVDYAVPSQSNFVFDDELAKANIAQVVEAVAGWQLAQFDIRSNKMRSEMRPSGIPNGWMYATLHVGLWHWAEASDSDLYRQTTMNLSQLNDYQLGPRVYHADDHAVGDVYLSIFNKYGGDYRIANTIAHFDELIEKPSTVSLEFVNSDKETHRFELRDFTDPRCTSRWCWADAVFMSPPVMAHLAKTTGDAKYLEFMDKEFWEMTEYLFDKDYGLYLRDSRYFERKDDQGRPIFWGRGNGWVLAGLARTIEYLPQDFAKRQDYIDLFQAMSKTLLDYQLEDGSWPSSLLEKNADTHSETSATGLLAYALAWGVNNNYLEADEFNPAIKNAWSSIVENIHPNGKVGYVQQVAFAPGSATKEDTQLYGSGAVILAAAELYKMANK
jgi:rhamnogalacturonyl hydrolase YesR